jgi:hypothetical protein
MKIFLLEGTKMTKLSRIRPFSPLERGDMSYLARRTLLPSDEIGIKVVALLMVDDNRRGRRAAIALKRLPRQLVALLSPLHTPLVNPHQVHRSVAGPVPFWFKIFDKKRKIRRKEGRKYVVSQLIGGFLASVA